MVDFIDEVREDLRRENMHNAWKRYGQWVVILAVLVVVATGGKVWWNNKNAAKQEELGKQYYDAVNKLHEGQPAEAQNLFASFETSSSKAYPALAGFKRAQNLIEANKVDEAITQYQTIASNTKVDPVLKDLAMLLKVNLEIAHHKSDSSAITGALGKLSTEEGVWRFSAQELQAAYALEQGDKQKAVEIYTALNNNYLTPPGIKQRASDVISALGNAPTPENNSTKAE